ncbi:glycerol-3-phosphate dehydrogenase/oxidase [Halalkalibacter lacteus]|uniref:glycerol-3-phosphate dehydrogenase/oxidase n=1 Tax=Halalkalibacter lacteus TaxID=3090663 RepID=UPI002FC9A657
MKRLFSSFNRKSVIDQMGRETFDVLVIGGGITGAGIAMDAANRGMSVALVEMQDFSSGTSSRSTKLIHGGLRYLKQFEVGLVAEVGKERAIVYENGPHVTKPEWMLLPIYRGGTFGRFSTSLGLRVYDYIAGVKKTERRQMLSAKETLEKEPLIKKEGLKGGGYYVEYRTDDARLTIEVVKEAVHQGAIATNYTKVETLLYENERLIGAEVKDILTGKVFKVYANKIINATGPWVDQLRELDRSKMGKYLKLSKGVHLVISQERFPLKQAVYFDTPDGRMMFAIPRDGKTYVGTTDTFYEGDVQNPTITESDRIYILQAIHYMFPNLKLKDSDVESSWAGLRPLIYEEGKNGKNPSEISRKDEIWQSKSGLVTIAGGKLTGYRKMAESVVDLLIKESSKKVTTCKTKSIPISGGDVGGAKEFSSFVQKKTNEAVKFGLTTEQGTKLSRLYGSNIDQVYAIAIDAKNEYLFNLPLDIYCSLVYGIKCEMVMTPADYFIRRTGALFFDIDWVNSWKEEIIACMAHFLKWSITERESYKIQLDQYIKEAVRPRK